MSYIGILLQGNTSMKTYSDGIEVIGKNTSNANTPGYQGQQVTFSEVFGDSSAVGVKINSQKMSLEKGDPEYTGNPLDLYLDGDGYFLLQDGKDHYLTRAGMFEINSNGKLVDQVSGNAVVLLSENGNPVEINATDHQIYEHVASSTLNLLGSLNSSISLHDTYPAEGDSPIVIKVIDSQGNTNELSIEFTKSSNGKWFVTIVDQKGLIISNNNEINFDNEGNIREEDSILNFNYKPVSNIENIGDFILQSAIYKLTDLSVDLIPKNGAEIPFYLNDELYLQSTASLALKDGKLVDINTAAELVLKDSSGAIISDISKFESKDALATSFVKLNGNLDEATLNGTVISDIGGNSISSNVIQVDGSALNLNFNFEKVDTREWKISILNDDLEEVTGDRTITFLSDGGLSPFSRRFTFDIEQLDGSIQTIEVILDDSDGSSLKQSASEVNINISESDGEPSSQLEAITIQQDGSISFTYDDGDSVAPLSMLLLEKTSQSLENLSLDFSSVDGDLSLSTDNPTEISIDDLTGLPEGKLINTVFNDTGQLSMVYSNGEKVEVASVAIVKVTDKSAVLHEGGSKLKVLQFDGMEIFSASESSSFGVISGAVELSNVDISDEFTKMVLLQRGYQASSHVVSVANSMLDDLYKAIE